MENSPTSMMSEIPNSDNFLTDDIFKLVINWGPGSPKAFWLLDQTNMINFINSYKSREPAAFCTIDGDIVAFDTDCVFLWTATNMGHLDIEWPDANK